MFEHVELNLRPLERETIDGVRYYKIPNDEELLKLVSITSVISHYNKEFFAKWRKKVGEDKANEITRKATSRGTDFHTLTEHLLKNDELPTGSVQPLAEFLYLIAKDELKNINKIHGLETALYSKELGVAGTVDCIAEYNGELSIIDFKTSKKAKPRDWIDHYFVQCAAYACMLYEMTGIIVKKFVIIMACEDGDCVVYQEYDKAKYIKKLSQYITKFVNDKLTQYEANV
jgi:CRISPR/Cas system-associated exonuclease Cas4 (RecB family)